jgi:hypothetical protein
MDSRPITVTVDRGDAAKGPLHAVLSLPVHAQGGGYSSWQRERPPASDIDIGPTII